MLPPRFSLSGLGGFPTPTDHANAEGEREEEWMTPQEMGFVNRNPQARAQVDECYRRIGLARRKVEEDTAKKVQAMEFPHAPVRLKLLLSSVPERVKASVFDELSGIRNEEGSKFVEMVHTLVNVPFSVYRPLAVSESSADGEICSFLVRCRDQMDRAVFGHDLLKSELLSLALSWTRRGSAGGGVIGIGGPMGVGKTSIAKCFAAAVGRPMYFIGLGGASGAEKI